jgi:hypothetical protein
MILNCPDLIKRYEVMFVSLIIEDSSMLNISIKVSYLLGKVSALHAMEGLSTITFSSGASVW